MNLENKNCLLHLIEAVRDGAFLVRQTDAHRKPRERTPGALELEERRPKFYSKFLRALLAADRSASEWKAKSVCLTLNRPQTLRSLPFLLLAPLYLADLQGPNFAPPN